jgi:alpha-D-xyloside xylohydrolase
LGWPCGRRRDGQRWRAGRPERPQASLSAVLDRNGSYVSVETYAPNIVRVTISQDKALASAAPGYGFIGRGRRQGLASRPEGRGRHLHLGRPVAGSRRPAVAGRALADGALFRAVPAAGLGQDAQGGRLGPVAMNGWEMSPHVVSGERTYQAGASFSTSADEHFYGLGQNQEGILDLRGRKIDCKHDYDAPHGETVCVPFLVSSKGYGILWDNPSDTHVYPAVNGRTLWQSKVGERVSFFVITGSYDEIYAGYRKLTGVTPLPPKAAFGYIQSKARYESQKQILDVAKGYRDRGYPLDVMVLDWFYWTRMGQLDIDPTYFPDPAAMNKELHDNGVHSIISVWPRFEKEGRYFNYLADKGWFLKDADGKPVDGLPFRSDRTGALIDSTNPEAREWFWGKIRDNIASKGFDWFWLDETEPDLVPEGHFWSIGSGDRYRNVFPLVHTQGVAEGSRRDRPDKRNLILSRAAYIGAQRNGALFWSSDIQPTWEALKRQVPTGLNFTASGMAYWGNDIGGWQWLPQTTTATKAPLLDPSDARAVVGQNNDYPELFARWFQYGNLHPDPARARHAQGHRGLVVRQGRRGRGREVPEAALRPDAVPVLDGSLDLRDRRAVHARPVHGLPERSPRWRTWATSTCSARPSWWRRSPSRASRTATSTCRPAPTGTTTGRARSSPAARRSACMRRSTPSRCSSAPARSSRWARRSRARPRRRRSTR